METLGGEDDWVLVTRDTDIRRNRIEKAAWIEANIPIIWLVRSWQNLQHWDFAWKFIRSWPEILRTVRRRRGIIGYRLLLNRHLEEIHV